MWNNEWKKGVDYPEWGETDVYKKTISGGYYSTTSHPEMRTSEYAKQSRVDLIDQS